MSQVRKAPRKTATETKKAIPGALGVYSFVHAGKAYALPPATECAPRIEAGVMIDAVMGGGDAAEMRLGLAMLMAADDTGKPLVDPATMKVLRSLPMPAFMEHLSAWMTQTGATPGK